MVKVGKSYHIYTKIPGRKQFRPMSGGTITFNLIHADIFEIRDQSEKKDFEDYLTDLRLTNPRHRFEAREVEW